MYAAKTDVPVKRTCDEIERLLVRHGATAFAYGWEQDQAAIGCTMRQRRLRFIIPLPKRDEFCRLRPDARRRTQEQTERVHAQAIRARYRALLLILKAKLEAIELGAVLFESEFLANIVLPSGEDVGGWLRPQLAAACDGGRLPALPAPEAGG